MKLSDQITSLSPDLYSKQYAIILVIVFICVLVSLGLLCVSLLNDKKEMRIFHAAFTGRKMLVEEGKLEYRVTGKEVERYMQVTTSPTHTSLPGQPGPNTSNIVKLKSNSSNLHFYGYVEDQPPEWAKLDYSLEVEIDINNISSFFPDIREGDTNGK